MLILFDHVTPRVIAHCMIADIGLRSMSAFVTLSSGRICLRRWRDEDREAFAAMYSDARVMEFFRSRLSRVESDAMVDRIEEHFSERDFGLWAIEVPDIATFIGLAGLAVARLRARFTPCVEVGWRLAFEHWGHGYATEAARLALGYGFGTLALSEVVSFTSATNHRSRAVMERLGMRRDPADDFDHPALPEGHPLQRHVLYRLGSGSYFGMC
jgi:RimJ/RimL family protein N-acetyltransferase